MQLDLNQLIRAFSDTVDLVGVDEVYHGKRVAYMAECCAESLGLDREERRLLFRLGLLHDCGVSSTKVHKQLLDDIDWSDSDQHCRLGAERLRQFTPLAPISDYVRYHHTRWQALQAIPLPAKTRRFANLIFLLDRVDALAAMYGGPNRLAVRESVLGKIVVLRESHFQPELVDLLAEVATREVFWMTMEPSHLEEHLRATDTLQEKAPLFLDEGDLRRFAALFGQIVDAKSRYTAEHSCGVASLARHLAERTGLPAAICEKIEIAGLLHDLGKLQVPDLILEFEGHLAHEELSMMRHHSFVTYQILKKISGLEDIARWAADHHEKLDGSGYPFRKTAAELGIESRIIIIADIFQALAQNRPYRHALPVDIISNILQEGAAAGQLDQDLVQLVVAESATCYRIACTSI